MDEFCYCSATRRTASVRKWSNDKALVTLPAFYLLLRAKQSRLWRHMTALAAWCTDSEQYFLKRSKGDKRSARRPLWCIEVTGLERRLHAKCTIPKEDVGVNQPPSNIRNRDGMVSASATIRRHWRLECMHLRLWVFIDLEFRCGV